MLVTELTAEQVRGARAMLRMEQAQLAEAAGVSVETVRRLEGLEGRLSAKGDTLRRIRAALEREGISFSEIDGDSPTLSLTRDKLKPKREMVAATVAGFTRAALATCEHMHGDIYALSKKELAEMLLPQFIECLQHVLPERYEVDTLAERQARKSRVDSQH